MCLRCNCTTPNRHASKLPIYTKFVYLDGLPQSRIDSTFCAMVTLKIINRLIFAYSQPADSFRCECVWLALFDTSSFGLPMRCGRMCVSLFQVVNKFKLWVNFRIRGTWIPRNHLTENQSQWWAILVWMARRRRVTTRTHTSGRLMCPLNQHLSSFANAWIVEIREKK